MANKKKEVFRPGLSLEKRRDDLFRSAVLKCKSVPATALPTAMFPVTLAPDGWPEKLKKAS